MQTLVVQMSHGPNVQALFFVQAPPLALDWLDEDDEEDELVPPVPLLEEVLEDENGVAPNSNSDPLIDVTPGQLTIQNEPPVGVASSWAAIQQVAPVGPLGTLQIERRWPDVAAFAAALAPYAPPSAVSYTARIAGMLGTTAQPARPTVTLERASHRRRSSRPAIGSR
jgi:hypothetical protein